MHIFKFQIPVRNTAAAAIAISAALACWSQSPSAATSPARKPAAIATPTTYLPNSMPRRARAYYSLFWGVDTLSVKAMESGELIRFSYRVLDGQRAKQLNDKNSDPILVVPEKRVQLVVPALEKVGKLRQSSTPIEGKVYWMAFSNPGLAVKRGDRVDVVIGQFHANGLVVQ